MHPGQSTILGAGKLTGRVGPFSVGTLTAVTQEEEARLAFGDARVARAGRAADVLYACRACGASSRTSRRSA